MALGKKRREKKGSPPMFYQNFCLTLRSFPKYLKQDVKFIVQMGKSPEFSTGPRVRWERKKTQMREDQVNGNRQYWIFLTGLLFNT